MLDRKGYMAVAEKSRIAFDSLSDKDVAKEAYRYGIRVTSGTSGGAQLVSIVRNHEYAFMRAKGITRCIIATGSWNSRLANVRYSLYASHTTQSLCVDVRELEGNSLRALEDFAADGISGFPSFVVRVLNALSNEGRARIRRLSLVGERLSPAHMVIFKEIVPQASIRTVYACAEFGVVGYQCGFLSPTFYHPVSGVSLSVIDPDTDGVGEAVLTRKQEGNVDVEQYHNGDAIRMVSGPCRCGEPITFEQMGRVGYDFVKLAGVILHVDAFDRVAQGLGVSIDEYRIEARTLNEGNVLRVALTIFIKGKKDYDILRLAFERNIYLTPTRTLGDLIQDGIFAPLAFAEFVENTREKKAIRLKVLNTMA